MPFFLAGINSFLRFSLSNENVFSTRTPLDATPIPWEDMVQVPFWTWQIYLDLLIEVSSQSSLNYKVTTMAPITITNSTGGDIQVRITNYEDQGSSDFFLIASGEPSVWQRDRIQSMTVFRSGNPVPDVLIVNPKETHNIQ
ncbi:uncharacterized protein EDB91DRAFT_1343867 [Suillus paluster]|uniref:uncharacterized protein n=1 Tax=Suillus paluster TaxID=48578 RepID=UPI001B87B087|nr:uncharacterized protein EDB91DRAFT_1343867 [Suillus paluster]KAG1751402.1 hypothetical protein EDB91DRAFT_1343867 [Suillus paluster]